jgi:DNA-binding NtrC family response regulator
MEEQNKADASGFENKGEPSFGLVGAAGKTALICEGDQALREIIAKNLKALNYSATFPQTAQEAIEAMNFHVFDVVVLDELFGTENSGNNDLLVYLSHQNMAMRRRFFVVLIGKNFSTMDKMAAFNQSVNMVVGTQDVDHIGEAVKQGVDEHNTFYHVFFETLQKIGKV